MQNPADVRSFRRTAAARGLHRRSEGQKVNRGGSGAAAVVLSIGGLPADRLCAGECASATVMRQEKKCGDRTRRGRSAGRRWCRRSRMRSREASTAWGPIILRRTDRPTLQAAAPPSSSSGRSPGHLSAAARRRVRSDRRRRAPSPSRSEARCSRRSPCRPAARRAGAGRARRRRAGPGGMETTCAAHCTMISVSQVDRPWQTDNAPGSGSTFAE